MIHDDSSALKRIKDVAIKNRVELPGDDGLTAREKIEAITSALNSIVFSNVEKHMLPSWVIKKIWQHGRKSEIPKIFPNDTHRNWTVIGSPGSLNFGVSDNHGLTTALEECGSFEFWPHDNEVIYPALLDRSEPSFKLVSIEDQMYEWSTSFGPINFQRLTYHSMKSEDEYIVSEIKLQNLSLDPQEFTFYVALRPFSVVGILPITELDYDPSTYCLFSNGLLALKLDRPPSSLVMSTFDDPNLLTQADNISRIDCEYRSPRGIATAIMKYDVKLPPAGRDTLHFIAPLLHTPKPKALEGTISPYGLRDQSVSRWFEFSEDLPAGEFPEEEIGNASAQAVVSLVVQIRRVISSQNSDELTHQCGEISRILLAITQSGYHSIARIALSEFISRFSGKGEIEKKAIELAPILWIINEMESLYPKVPLSDDIRELKEILEGKVKASLLECTRLEFEESPPKDTAYLDDDEIPSIESIEQRAMSREIPTLKIRAIQLDDFLVRYWVYLNASRMHFKDDDFSTALECYKNRLIDEAKKLVQLKSWDYEKIEDVETVLGVISAFTITKNFDIGSELFETLVSGMREKRFYRGLLRYPGKNPRISSHHALRIAHAFVLLRTRHEAELILGKITDYLSDFFYLPDWIDPKTKGGTLGNGCSITAAADLRLLIRDMIVYEDHDDLFVLAGIPEYWFTSKEALSVENMPTRIGNVSISTGVSTNQHQLEIKMERLPEEIEISLPEHIPMHMVKVFGGSVIDQIESHSNRIRLIPLSEQITITFHRQ